MLDLEVVVRLELIPARHFIVALVPLVVLLQLLRLRLVYDAEEDFVFGAA